MKQLGDDFPMFIYYWLVPVILPLRIHIYPLEVDFLYCPFNGIDHEIDT